MSEILMIDTTPAEPPSPEPIEGRYVTLERLSEAHIPDLWRHYTVDDSTFTMLPSAPPSSQDELANMLTGIERRGGFAFVLMAKSKHLGPSRSTSDTENERKEAVGIVMCGDLNSDYRTTEAGAILSPVVRRSAVATEAHYLLLKKFFDPENGPRYRRVCWKTDSAHIASCRAAERLGYTYEGTWRNHMIVRGRSRDSAWYSIIDDDWELLKEAFDLWLDPSNFDGDGEQKRKLQDIRESLR